MQPVCWKLMFLQGGSELEDTAAGGTLSKMRFPTQNSHFLPWFLPLCLYTLQESRWPRQMASKYNDAVSGEFPKLPSTHHFNIHTLLNMLLISFLLMQRGIQGVWSCQNKLPPTYPSTA